MERRIGRYQILEEIASGGRGAVFRAFDPDSGQILALKVLHASLSGDRSYIERFRREASLAASIDHPNVVRIFEVGQDDGRHFIALEYLPENLSRVIERGGAMQVERAAGFGVQMAEGLAAAHALGIVHRDVKPQNVLIGQDGTAKVTDFGIARGELLATMTATGAVMGTPHYMSPEQARGERADARSDVYALGCVLYQMLSGEVPFRGDTPLAVIRQQIESEPRRLREVRREVPRDLAKVVERAMMKDPGRRYQSAAELSAALGAAVPGAVSAAPRARPRTQAGPWPAAPSPSQRLEVAPPTRRKTTPRRSSFRWLMIGGVAVIAVAAVAAGAYLGILGDRPKDIFPDEPIEAIKEIPEAVADKVAEVLDNVSAGGAAEGEVTGTGNGVPGTGDTIPIALPAPNPQSQANFPDQQPFGEVVVLSDSSWKVSDEDQPGWNDVGFDDASWTNAEAPWEFWDHDDLSPAQPMWHPGRHDDDFEWFYFRKTFFLPSTADPVLAQLILQVDDDYMLFINGHAVARDGSGTTEAPSMHDILPYLNVGENVVAVRAIDSFGGDEGVNLKLGVALNGDGPDQAGIDIPGSASGIAIRAYIDGRSRLIIKRDTVQWFHLGNVAPGRFGDSLLPTFINGQSWMPRWPDRPNSDNSYCGCESSKYRDLAPPLRKEEIEIKLDAFGARGHVSVVETPTRENNYTLVIEFDDNDWDGAEWYEVSLFWASVQAPIAGVSVGGSGLRRGATISGRVTDSITGQPIYNARIVAKSPDRDGARYESDTDMDGLYTLNGLAPGTYVIRAEAERQGYIRMYYDDRADRNEADLVTVLDSRPIEDVDFEMTLGATISGRVTDVATGRAIVDLNFSAGPEDGDDVSWTNTDGSGFYVLRGLPEGVIKVEVEGQGYIIEYFTVRVAGSAPVEGVDLQLQLGATISGRVTDAASGRPAANVNIGAGPIGQGRISWTDTDRDGFYVLRGLPNGVFEVDAGSQGYMQQRVNVRMADFVSVEGVDFALSIGASISGRVTDAKTGLPIANINLRAGPENNGHVSWADSNGNGFYFLDGLPGGVIEVEMEGRGYIRERVTIRLTVSEPHEGVDFELTLGATISGRVTDSSTGLPIANIEVNGGTQDEGGVSWTESDRDGYYTLVGVPNGVIEVEARGQDYIQERMNVRIADLEPLEGVDIALRLGATISGRVTDATTGLPISGVEMDANSRNGGGPDFHSHAHSNADGRFTFRGLGPGAYEIRASADRQGYVQELYDDTLDWDDADLVTVVGVEAVQGVDFSLTLGATISGRVSDAETGLPIPDMDINAGPVNGGHISWATTGIDGNFTLRGLPDGDIEVVVRGQGYIEVQRIATIIGGRDIVGFDF